MKVESVNSGLNKNPNFGHSFRVNICLDTAEGIKHVNPASDSTLYKKLNSTIVSALNDEYIQSLRNVYGIRRKTPKQKILDGMYKSLVDDLKEVDTDYMQLGLARTIYRKNKLALIATGTDVAVLENTQGAKEIGKAKALKYSKDYIIRLVNKVKSAMIDYVKSSDVLLRSENNKEIMLKTIFKEVGKSKKGNPIYELSDYEFHENLSLPTLPPVSKGFRDFKNGPEMENIINSTIRHYKDNMLKKKNY